MNSIESLIISSNNLTAVDINNLTTLIYVNCADNQLTELNVSSLVNINELFFGNNHITQIDVSNLTVIDYLECANNQMTSLDVSNLPTLTHLACGGNLYQTLDLSNQPHLALLHCNNSPQLSSLFIKNGSYENLIQLFTLANDPQLAYICADELQVEQLQYIISNYPEYNNPGCVINSYCSLTPGGEFYTISGNAVIDAGSDGCDASDVNMPFMKFLLSDGAQSGTAISDASGNYTIPVQAATHQVTPVMENPSYFNISPATVTVTFPNSTSPYTQNFCVTPNGPHADLELTIIPLSVARPGFDATYEIVYENKGNQLESGTINMLFNGTVAEFVSSDTTVAAQSANSLSWGFMDLVPFQSGKIHLILNINSPQEIPPVNANDVLLFTAEIISLQTDETPLDNTFTLNQTVVNSLDPNDKTCLEGNTITPEMVGKYIHYMIRFENTGTANAQNIVVKDMIDISKFDISSLIPLDGSHPFITRITDTNKVEFIFGNIQLPFDNTNNDGYVAFKIKTKPTLVVGNTFSNTANIYFDYNAPIITNTATTAIQVLGTDDFDFNNHFTLYPNPAEDILNIKSKDNIKINALSVYNTLGQLVLTVTNPAESIDVSDLASGNYLIKINADKGISNTKFVKK